MKSLDRRPAIAAMIFDMDGVIVDSELQWQLAEGELFGAHVPRWRSEDHHKIVGLGVEDLYHFLVREYSLATEKEEFLADCHDLAQVVYKQRVSLTTGFKEFLDEVRRRRIPTGVASSSPKAWLSLVFQRFSLQDLFDVAVCADDVPSGRTKPKPDTYRLALERLGVAAAGAWSIEDSTLGVSAAKGAGLSCAALRNGSNDSQDLSQADFEVRSFAELRRRLL